MSDELIVGCPIYKRAWAVPAWFEHVHKACDVAGVEPTFAFVVDQRDEETILAISEQHGGGYVLDVREPEEHDGTRTWNKGRYEWMVHLRNELLGVVRLAEPEHFLSLDSDILVHQDTIANLLETAQAPGVAAVGGKTYMTSVGTQFPSFANLTRSKGLRRWESVDVIPVEVIMAIKLMTPEAYNVNYEFHAQGEDIGWSLSCREKGLKFLWDGRATNKHVMEPSQLDRVDKRVGF